MSLVELLMKHKSFFYAGILYKITKTMDDLLSNQATEENDRILNNNSNATAINLRNWPASYKDGYFVLFTDKGIIITSSETNSTWHTPHQCGYVLLDANYNLLDKGQFSCLNYRINLAEKLGNINIINVYYTPEFSAYEKFGGVILSPIFFRFEVVSHG